MIGSQSDVAIRLEQVFPAATAAVTALRDQLAAHSPNVKLEDDFQRLAWLIDALPLAVDRIHICFLRNWTASSRKLWRAGETGTARYQLRQIERMLNRIGCVTE